VKDAEFKRKRKKAYALMAATGVRRNQSIPATGNDSNLLIVFYVQIMPDDFVMQLHRF